MKTKVKKAIRAGIYGTIFGLCGWAIGIASKSNNIAVFTIALVASILVAALVTKILGPIHRKDERALRRSAEAARTAIRISAAIGILLSAYAGTIGAPKETIALGGGMAIPAAIWFIVYLVYKWRDII